MEARELVQDFERLLRQADGEAATTSAYVGLLEPGLADLFERCAIPHEFDAALLRILSPALGADDAARRFEELAALSLVAPALPGRLALHSTVRRDLFRTWLAPARRPELARISARLDAHLSAVIAATPEGSPEHELALRRRMYHRLGADEGAGIAELERLARRARSQSRTTECAALLRLVHDYEDALAPEHALAVAYQRGKLELDEGTWTKAAATFLELAETPAASGALRAKALVRLGFALCEQGRRREALEAYARAEDVIRADPSAAVVEPRVLFEQAIAWRELGDLDRAERLFEAAAARAEAVGSRGALSAAANGLGLLLLRRGDPTKAVDALERSLAVLDPARDALRIAQVENNLGSAYADLADWVRSEDCYRRSLEIRRRSGDVPGEALALVNLARVRFQRGEGEEAVQMAVHAARRLEDAGDPENAARARLALARFQAKLGRPEPARDAFREAAALFERAGDRDSAAGARDEADRPDEKVGVPWWAWASMAVVVLLFLGFVALVVAAMR
jgi:tetratricopeptide (TPR) repeat protein